MLNQIIDACAIRFRHGACVGMHVLTPPVERSLALSLAIFNFLFYQTPRHERKGFAFVIQIATVVTSSLTSWLCHSDPEI